MTVLVLVFATLLAPAFPSGDSPDLAELERQFRAGKGYAELVARGPEAIPVFVRVLNDPQAGTPRFLAANGLGEIAHADCFDPLIAALDDPWFNVRRCAALALGKLGDARAIEPLKKLAEQDPYTYRNPKTGKRLHLVRIDARQALVLLGAGPPLPETFLKDAQKRPDWTGPRAKKVSWPFPGGFRDQNLYNNYQQPTGSYVHAALDLLHEAGTEVRAVEGGVVRGVGTNYPEWNTHHFIVIEPEAGSSEGWCYAHIDPATFRFEIGDSIEPGQVLGKLVEFGVGDRTGVDHLHLSYVRFSLRELGEIATCHVDGVGVDLTRRHPSFGEGPAEIAPAENGNGGHRSRP